MQKTKASAAAVLLAGGNSVRFNAYHGKPKPYCVVPRFGTLQVLICAVVEQFLASMLFDIVIVVIRRQDEGMCSQALESLLVGGSVATIDAAPTRQASVLASLNVLESRAIDFVLVHDVVRPFLSHGLISRVLDGLNAGADAVVPVVESTDSMLRIDGDNFEYIKRDGLYRVQTPQGLRFSKAIECYRMCAECNIVFSDEGSLMEYCGVAIKVVPGEHNNTKITFMCDIDKDMVQDAMIPGVVV